MNQAASKNDLILLGLFVNLLVLVSVSDLYFSNSHDKGIRLIEPPTNGPPAKRLVLILADGLSYEALLGNDSPKSLFLSKTKSRGSWGVALSQFPTIRRSGHSAIFTGTSECPLTAIINNWISKPVAFDSLLRQSKHVWFWGSPDIFHQFSLFDLPQVHIASLPEKGNEDTESRNQRIAFDIKSFLSKNKHRVSFGGSIFNEYGTLFMAHLPLNDLTGRGRGSGDSLRKLDKNIEAITHHFSQVFADNATAFIVASAYGLTNWGSHGGESNLETRTPFIAWGAGIKTNVNPIDIKLVDVAPLLACLIGVSIPRNSLGVLPLEYLDLPQEHYVSEQATNALQLAAVFEAKRRRILEGPLGVRGYKNLTSSTLSDRFAHLKFLHFRQNYSLLTSECRELINDLLQGIKYYQTYHKRWLICSILLGYSLWLFWIFNRTWNSYVGKLQGRRPLIVIMLVPVYVSYVQCWPFLYYIYSGFPFAMLLVALPYLQLTKYVSNEAFVCLPPLLVLFMSIFCRYVVSLALLLAGASVFIKNSFGESLSIKSKVLWTSLCAILSFWASLPHMGPSAFSTSFQVYGFSIWMCLISRWLIKLRFGTDMVVFIVQQVFLVLVAVWRIFAYFGAVQSKFPAWALSLVPLVLIVFTSNTASTRIAAFILGTLPFYLMASSSGELFFLAVYLAALILWWIIATKCPQELDEIDFSGFENHQETIDLESERSTALLSGVFLLTGFFGGGNISNISSYSPLWIRPLASSISNPVIGTVFVAFKISIPVFVCVFIICALKQNAFKIICTLLLTIDVIIFGMLLLLALDVGTFMALIGLSQLIMAGGFTWIILVAYKLVEVLMSFSPLSVIVQKFWLFNKPAS